MNTTVFSLLTLSLAACATMTPPTDRMARTEGSIRGASEVGAGGVPRASLHLRLAQEQFQSAKTFMRSGDNQEAALMFLRAQADAELALQLTRQAQAEASSQQAESELRWFESNTKP